MHGGDTIEGCAMNSERKRDRHHRKPRSMGGRSDRQNISSVRPNMHRAYHTLFGPGDPEVIARILNAIWIDPKYELVVRERRPKGGK